MRKIHLALPSHHSKNIQREQHTLPTECAVGMLQEICNYIGAFPAGVLSLKNEAGIFLIALRREANIVELNFIYAGLGSAPGERDVVFLNLGVGRICPDEFAIFPPGLTRPTRIDRQFRMCDYQVFIAEDSDTSNGVYSLGMQKVGKFCQIRNDRMAFVGGQRMRERDVQYAVAVF